MTVDVGVFVQLAANPKNLVFLLSEHDRHTVDSWFTAYPDHKIHLTAEHGHVLRHIWVGSTD